jgi:hypothetical protein
MVRYQACCFRSYGNRSIHSGVGCSQSAMYKGALWKYEDDGREVDMSRFQGVEQETYTPTEAEIEQARDLVNALKGDNDQMITMMRLSDGFVSATKMCQSAGKMWTNYKDVEGHREYMNALASSLVQPADSLVQSIVTGPNAGRGTWVHPQLAIHLATWCSSEFAVKVTGLVLRYMSGQVTTGESRAAAGIVNERAVVAPEDDDEDFRALKRQRVQNELARETANHANEMARLQSESFRLQLESSQERASGGQRLLDTLSAGNITPALKGVLSAAHHNLSIQCVAVLEGGNTVAAETSTAGARRVTVLELGRDTLGLKGDDVSNTRLMVVGTKLGKLWMRQPGRGSIVVTTQGNGEKQWELTVKEDGVVRKTNLTLPVDASTLANNRIKYSVAFNGHKEAGNGQSYDVWTYQFDQVEPLIREAFQKDK